MIIGKLMGGLGNQMFCYAAARRLAHRHDVPLKLDLSDYRKGTDQRPKGLEAFSREVSIFNFNVTATEATESEIVSLRDPYISSSTRDRVVRLVRRCFPRFLFPASHVREKSYRFDPNVLELGAKCYLSGFWQSEKYFADATDVIRQEFTFRDAQISTYVNHFLARLKATTNGPIVSVHVRRGDLACAKEQLAKPGLVHGLPVTLDYIHSAMARFDDAGGFLIFSDSAADIAWCRQNINAKCLYFSEGHSDIEDFALMSACDHHIIANSSFSWWAAWLNRKVGRRVIAPRKWFASSVRTDLTTDDLIPVGWEFALKTT